MKPNIGLVILLSSSFFTICHSSIPVILDTDIGPYTDDVGAMAILNAYMEQDLINIRAVVANDRYEGIVPVIEAMNRYFNRTNIQIGITKDPTAHCTEDHMTWPHFVVDNYPHPMYQHNDEAEDAVTLYRRMLATSPNESVLVVSIGHFTNLGNLLKSPPDQYSSLDGIELVRLKTKKMIAMAGEFPRGSEWNIMEHVESARTTFQLWPTEIVFAGFEIGRNLKCGQGLLSAENAVKLAHSPVRKAWLVAKEEPVVDDGCFDEVAALVVDNGIRPLFSLVYGHIELSSNGSNHWVESPGNAPTKMAYLKKKETKNDEDILKLMDPMLEQ